MTFYYDNVYLNCTATICGPIEKNGPLYKYFDKCCDDFYFKEKSYEKAEIKFVRECLKLLLKKSGMKNTDIDVTIGGDLLNQIVASTYGCCGVGNSFIGIYGACSSSVLGMIIGANFIDSGKCQNACVVCSSHNLASEKQFRNPTEYGAPRPKTSTFTSTGAASCLLSNKKSTIRVESSTLGCIVDFEQNNANDMGRVMAPAAAEVLVKHLKDTGRKPDYYDLILTGDLGIYGREILIDYLREIYKIDLSKNYNDCGVLLYDRKVQKEVHAGGSGPVCSGLVNFSYIYNLLLDKKLNKVLLIATGALFSSTSLFQKENINSIAHAISLEVCDVNN